ncbi:RNA polymerase subunit sigma-70 [Cyanobium sp. T1G-Tous]|uniref:sigma-70 family RNA polymerase sigma factor n=1 Tax=unclassified Cyanobium TaxID=2627006 RepID=UPI0020CEEBE4|nr:MULTISPECIES: sigma factor [unclassified Cyanobium]MCP9803465.1 RNA polymerase subunit sigma-70 [Cyanobium sp. T1G-Tous]MCP9806917.1 RNA polymerase subunit sigma-70 [Cyanobium sp. T1B-Tous]MCP9875814.1 RNA polymerase subunit sigma-70 [Cyanobium sp. A2C-AMD]
MAVLLYAAAASTPSGSTQLPLPLRPAVPTAPHAHQRRRLPCSHRPHPPAWHMQLVLAFPDPIPPPPPPPPRHRHRQRSQPRRRPVHPHAAANALVLQHLDLAEKIAGNFARRTVHCRDDLLQLATLGLIKAARRYEPGRGPFRPYGRTFANGEITHWLRDHGFLIKVPPTWRELHVRGQRLLQQGRALAELPGLLGITAEQWQEIVLGCSQRVVAYDSAAMPDDSSDLP